MQICSSPDTSDVSDVLISVQDSGIDKLTMETWGQESLIESLGLVTKL